MTRECATRPDPGYFSAFVEGRRGEILDAALDVFAEFGYEAGTMREIAARVGVSEPALYRHYSGKEALLIDLMSTAGEHITGEARQRLAQIQPETLRESMVNLLHMQPLHSRRPRNIMKTLMNAAPHNTALRATFREKFGTPMVDNVRDFVGHVDHFLGIERTVEEADARVRSFMSIFVGYHMTSMFFETQQDDAIVDAMFAIMGWNPAE